MKSTLAVLALFCFSVPALSDTKNQIKITIAAPSEDQAVQVQASSPNLIINAIHGARTANLVLMVNAIINGDHARLKCYENHRGCTALGPGEYDAEIDKKHGDVWINIVVPVSRKLVRDHWRVVGTW